MTLKTIPVKQIEPTPIAMQWVNNVVEELRLAFLTNKTSIELGQPFNVVYERYRWFEVMAQALYLCEKVENYELCTEIKTMQSKLSTHNSIYK